MHLYTCSSSLVYNYMIVSCSNFNNYSNDLVLIMVIVTNLQYYYKVPVELLLSLLHCMQSNYMWPRSLYISYADFLWGTLGLTQLPCVATLMTLHTATQFVYTSFHAGMAEKAQKINGKFGEGFKFVNWWVLNFLLPNIAYSIVLCVRDQHRSSPNLKLADAPNNFNTH